MGRKIPNYKKKNFYHLYNRGANKSKIFFEAEYYTFLLKKVRKYSQEFDISVIAYCLMPNHYHFLVRLNGKSGAGTFIQRIFNSYTKAINNRYNRTGTLFEGPYNAIHVDKRNYLKHLCRYIHRNPFDADLVKKYEAWPYSNYPEWVKLRNGRLYDPKFVNYHFRTPQEYKKFMDNYESPDNIEQYLF